MTKQTTLSKQKPNSPKKASLAQPFSVAPSLHECVLKVPNKMGIHARPAAMIVRIATKYPEAKIEVEKDSERVNGKSIMGLMTLAAGKNSDLRFMASGKNAKAFIREISSLFESAFGEI